jgi:hypothetical protein
LNVIGFSLGSLHGATTDGFIPTIIPGMLGLVIGDLVFGGMIGFVQYIALIRTRFLPVTSAWILATSLGFTLGARSGALLTFRITHDWTPAGILFGVFMGASIGLVTAFVLFRKFSLPHLLIWLATCTLAWIAGESVAFAAYFSLRTVPLVALAIAIITGLGLLLLQPRLQAE